MEKNMKIHTWKKGDTIENIAKEYGVRPEFIFFANDESANPTVGEELLILTPTRTHKVRQGDTPERLMLRYGIKRADLIMQNPDVLTDGLLPDTTVVLKYDERPYGASPTNGYIYKDYDKSRLKRALPYLTYVTVSSAVADGGGVKFTFDDSSLIKMLLLESKIPLLRIFDSLPNRNYRHPKEGDKFINDIIYAASGKGYMGVVLSSEGAKKNPDEFGEFIVKLRKAMIGCDLILITEVDEEIPGYICDLSDGNVFSYPKYEISPETPFSEGEFKKYSDYAKEAESAKTFIDIPCLAKIGGDFITVEDALSLARECGAEIVTDGETLVSHFDHKTRGGCKFQGLESVKRTFDLIDDLGFMGASFDVSRTPISYFLMYNTLFKTMTQPRVRAVEGCSEGR